MSSPVSQNPFLADQQANSAEPAAANQQNPVSPFGDPNDGNVFEFDLTDAASSGRIMPGNYLMFLTDVTNETSRNSGNPMVVFKFEIIRNADGTPSTFAGRSISRYCALVENAMGILTAVVESLGLGAGGQKVRYTKDQAMNRLVYGTITEGLNKETGGKTANLAELIPYQPIGTKWNRQTGQTYI